MLLATLQTPVRSVFQVIPGPSGQVLHEHLFTKEEEKGFFELMIRELAAAAVQLRNTVANIRNTQWQATAARRRAEAIEQQIADENTLSARANARAYEVLHQLTSKDLNANPVAWWDWWKDCNEAENPAAKPTCEFVSSEAFQYRPLPPPSSCFPVGTLVWTQRGIAAIETIKVGDRVLAQDVTTAELQYKLVNVVTRRTNAPMQKLMFDEMELILTTGHPLWINGAGWRMAKRIQLGDRAHALAGSK